MLAVRNRHEERRAIPERMQPMRRYFIFFIIPLIFVLDRWTKWLVTENLGHGGSVEITPYFSLVYWRNLGGAFGFLSQHHLGKYVFMVLPLVVAAALVYALFAYKWPALKTFLPRVHPRGRPGQYL